MFDALGSIRNYGRKKQIARGNPEYYVGTPAI